MGGVQPLYGSMAKHDVADKFKNCNVYEFEGSRTLQRTLPVKVFAILSANEGETLLLQSAMEDGIL